MAKAPLRCVVAGGTRGLGRHLVSALVNEQHQVTVLARSLPDDSEKISSPSVFYATAELANVDSVQAAVNQAVETMTGIDVWINVVGASDRGRVDELLPDRLAELFQVNVTTALLAAQAAKIELEKSKGVLINIGSLAGKVGARYLGGYVAAKHALSGLTQQLRLEWKPLGIHVGLISPGPIRRDDAGKRYKVDSANVPQAAAQPGGGTKIKGLPPEKVAAAVLRMIDRRSGDVMMPGHLRLLVALGHLFPRMGDWLLLKFSKD